MSVLPYKISVLIFVRDEAGRHLLIRRRKQPNIGLWSPVGGKLEMATGESPHECAVRELKEETGLEAGISELHLFGMIAEKSYEGGAHWLMFLYDCRKRIGVLPVEIDEGQFGFFTREEVELLPLPATDRTALWEVYDKHRHGFVVMRADCDPSEPLKVEIEELIAK